MADKKDNIQQAFRNEFNRFKKKIGAPDLRYILQESSSDENLKPTYAFQITGLSSRLTPISYFSSVGYEDLLAKVRDPEIGLENKEYDLIEIAWLQANAAEHQRYADEYRRLAKEAENRYKVEGSTSQRTQEVLDNGEGELR